MPNHLWQALVDAELTASMLKQQLLQRVMLFAPESAGGGVGFRSQRPALAELSAKLETAVTALCRLSDETPS